MKLAISGVADEMMLKWVTLPGHCQEQSIFMLNLQEKMHYICFLVCLFIYFGSELFFTHLVMCLWGNDFHGGTEKLLSKPVSVWEEWGGDYTHPKMCTQFSSAHF